MVPVHGIKMPSIHLDHNAASAPKFAQVHIPKTGGNSLRVVLERQISNCRTLELNSPEESKIFAESSALEKVKFDLITGHFAYGSDANLPRRFRYFTMLRDPVERVISQYHHLMSLVTSFELAQQMRQERWSIGQFVRSGAAKPLVFSYVYYLGAFHQEPAPRAVTLNELVERVVVNLATQFEFVGILERWDECLVCLRDQLGFEIVDIPHRNTTPDTAKLPISPQEREEVRAAIGIELQIYEIAQQLFESRVSSVDSMERKVKDLSKLNRREFRGV